MPASIPPASPTQLLDRLPVVRRWWLRDTLGRLLARLQKAGGLGGGRP